MLSDESALEDKARELYETLYQDPLNQMQKYFPRCWEEMEEVTKDWWVALVSDAQVD